MYILSMIISILIIFVFHIIIYTLNNTLFVLGYDFALYFAFILKMFIIVTFNSKLFCVSFSLDFYRSSFYLNNLVMLMLQNFFHQNYYKLLSLCVSLSSNLLKANKIYFSYSSSWQHANHCKLMKIFVLCGI